ncbi:MAG: VOC family protein [Nitrospira sp.]|jgi:predicted 3-demethylubiquinone-9 3-methyltransferase (glyoxalase superfamily)|nr:VOC family protein [Nitrospira sp.]MDI3464051.1 3-demethylubiquinone-9 3-methyltransferase [Nitrospira sp.]
MPTIQRITPCLWFDDKAEEAAKFYVSIFKNSRMGPITHYGEAGAQVSGRPKGSVMTVTFKIENQEFVALNGGPLFKFTEAVSLMVKCTTQNEIDEMWEKLSEGGEPGPCGWLKDTYGLSWQIVSPEWDEMLRDKDPKRSERVMEAILHMTKPDLGKIRQAYEGNGTRNSESAHPSQAQKE